MDGATILSVFSFGVTIGVAIWQIHIFRGTKRNLSSVATFFPDTPDYAVTGGSNEPTAITSSVEGEMQSLITELNQYIECNKGTTDFSIIQNKTERRTDTVYEKATAKLSFPTYIGLMGTFAGVLIGLFGFSFFGEEETRIDNLVHGVMVSMFTSLLGLWLTTRGNHFATETKEILDNRKNQFYDFLQNSLMPSLGTSMVAALDRLRDTLGTFEPTFSSVIQKFESSFVGTIELFRDTFDSCTVSFGEEFRKNSELLNRGVDKMAHSVDLINANVDNQRQLLEEIRSTKMWDTLNQFVEVAGILEQASKHIEGLRDVGKMIEEQVMALMTAQEEYTKSLAVPKVLTERINNLLDRVSTFEKSINNLGPAISSSELIATKELNDIKAHLDRIAQQNFQANRYAEMQTEKLEEFFAEQSESIKQLNVRYRALMEEHGEKLNEVLEESIDTLGKKRSAFLRAVEDAFDVAEINTQFSHLEALPRLETALAKLEEQLSVEHAEMIDITSMRPTREDIKSLNSLVKIEKAVSSIDDLTNRNKESLEQIIENLETSDVNERLHQLDAIKATIAEIKESVDSIQSIEDSAAIGIIKSEVVKLVTATNTLRQSMEEKTEVLPTGKEMSQHLSDIEIRLAQIEKQLKPKRRQKPQTDSEE